MNRTVISAGVLCLLFLLAVLAVYMYQLPVATWIVLASAVVVLLTLFLLVRRSIRPRTTKA
jgi:O-antigen/teichoic acid export membrane protein